MEIKHQLATNFPSAGGVPDLAMGGFPDAPDDPDRMARMIINSFTPSPAPFRLVLGSGSDLSMKTGL